MSFVWKADKRLRTPEQVMAIIISTVNELNMPDKRGAAICAGMCVAQESDFWCPWNAKEPSSKNFPFDSQSDDGRSVGYYQQQTGPKGELWWGPVSQEMDVHLSTREFLTRLKKNGYNASSAQAANDSVQAVQRSGVPQGYVKHWGRINTLYDNVSKGVQPVPDNRPDFNEWPMWSPNNSDRRGTKVDLFILHTQEGGGGDAAAENLAKYLQGNEVSYHYSIGQASDGGVTVVDVVDTDQASWSVLSANPRSINLCFAGSKASWTRDQWMQQSKAIDVAAYLAVQDCKKYGIPLKVIGTGGNYSADRAGVTDHQYVTKVLKDGTHTDVGAGFPLDYFKERFAFWATGAPATPPVVTPPAPPVKSDRQLLQEIWDQLRIAWPQLGGRTLVDAVAELLKDKA